MRRIHRGGPSILCICTAILLTLPSIGTAQKQEEKKSLIGALGRAYAGGAVGGGSVLALGIVMRMNSGGGEGFESVAAVMLPLFPLSGVLGSALGIRSWDKENCSLYWTLLGAAAPLVIGAISGAVTAEPIADDPGVRAVVGAFFGSLASPLGATIGYALSRRVQPAATGALLHIEGSELGLGFPSPVVRSVLQSRDKVTWQYQIALVSARF